MKIALPLYLSVLALVSPSGRAIPWRADYAETLAAAAEQRKVVFLAVNMDGERANDRMVEEVYRDPGVRELAGYTLPLVASAYTHAPEGKACPRFGENPCRAHQQVDIAARGELLKPDPEGFVVAPQHVFLGPDGKVLLSVPFEIAAEELEWCLATALRMVDPDSQARPSRKARAPKRLILGDVLGGAAAAEAAPATREEALELVARLKRGTLDFENLERAVRRLATADEPEAREYVLSLLRSNLGGGRGGGAGGGRGAGAGQGTDRRLLLLRWIGFASPPSYWEVCNEFLGSGERALQQEAIVALEQLAAPASLNALQGQLRREKDPATIHKLLRAIGTTGRDDRNARTVLLKQVEQSRTPLSSVHALIAASSLTAHADVQAALRAALGGKEDPLRIAAALGAALTRDVDWLELLRAELAGEPSAELKAALEAAIAVLEGAPLSRLREPLMRVAQDKLERPRFFGRAQQGP